MTALRATLIALVGSLLALGCEDKSKLAVRSLPVSKLCELAVLAEPSEEKCVELCGDDDVDRCKINVDTSATCAPASAKTDSTPVPNALRCETITLTFSPPPILGEEQDGRRPEGFVASMIAMRDLGSVFAASHELEAASIDAFERLARELAAFGAPANLVARARAAKQDEIRHARWTAILARKHGVEPPVVAPAPLGVRCLLEMALENVVEGVVRETYGAARALYRAGRVPDVRARRVLERIAADELRHAELSWDVAVFASERLSASERHLVATAAREALADLGRCVPPADEVRRQAGLPDRHASACITRALEELLADASFIMVA